MLLPLVLLIHSPLLGTATWNPAAVRLRRRGWRVGVPRLVETERTPSTYWQQHVRAVERFLERDERRSLPVVLVGHNGAGPLLPCIAAVIDRPVGLVFVDSGIPKAGASRLDLLADEAGPDIADKLRVFLESGRSYPVWRDAELKNLIPDAKARYEVLQEVTPRPLSFWEEPLSVPDGWITIPSAYLRLSQGYAVPAAEAQRRGWSYREMDEGHFHMVVDPEVVASELIELLTLMGLGNQRTAASGNRMAN